MRRITNVFRSFVVLPASGALVALCIAGLVLVPLERLTSFKAPGWVALLLALAGATGVFPLLAWARATDRKNGFAE